MYVSTLLTATSRAAAGAGAAGSAGSELEPREQRRKRRAQVDPVPKPVHQHRPPRVVGILRVGDRAVRARAAHEEHHVCTQQLR